MKYIKSILKSYVDPFSQIEFDISIARGGWFSNFYKICATGSFFLITAMEKLDFIRCNVNSYSRGSKTNNNVVII